MPAEDTFINLVNEIDALRRQQEQNLNDYREKVSVLSDTVKSLEGKKLDLEQCITDFVNKADDQKNILVVERAKAEGIVSAANADAVAIVKQAKLQADGIISEADDVLISANETKKRIESCEEGASLANKDAVIALNSANDLRVKAEQSMFDADKMVEYALKAEAKANALIESIDAKNKALDAKDGYLMAKEEGLKGIELFLGNKKQELIDELSNLDAQKKQFAEESFNALEGIKAKFAEIEELRAGLIEQKERNKFKDAELDAVFSKLKREQEDLRKAQEVIKSMKKELSQ